MNAPSRQRAVGPTDRKATTSPHPDRLRELTAVARLCFDLLDVQITFCDRMDQLLTDIATTNLFATEAVASLNLQMHDLQRQQVEMDRRRASCERALSTVVHCTGRAVRMSDLEPHLDAPTRTTLRQRRLRVVSRLEASRRLLRRTDVLLTSRQVCFADLLGALTGRPASSNCYQANGRRGDLVAASFLEAVS